MAADKLTGDDVLSLLDVSALFDMSDKPRPNGRDAILDALTGRRMVEPIGGGHWRIFNLGDGVATPAECP